MKKLLTLMLLLFAVASATWNIANTTYCRDITVTNYYPAGYAHKITFNTSTLDYAHAQALLQDVRIYEGNCSAPNVTAGALPIWNLSINTSGDSILFARSVNANISKLSVYYGNASLAAAFNFGTTMDCGDDFSYTGTANSSRWTPASLTGMANYSNGQYMNINRTTSAATSNRWDAAGCTINYDVEIQTAFYTNTTTPSGYITGMQVYKDANNYLSWFTQKWAGGSPNLIGKRDEKKSGTYAEADLNTSNRDTSVHTYKMLVNGSTGAAALYLDGINSGNRTNSGIVGGKAAIYLNTAPPDATEYEFYDYFYVRKWIATEPTYSIGAEQTNTTTINPEIVNITLTPASPYTEDNLNCTFYVRDNDSATVNITANWYKNGVLNQNETLTSQAANATYSFILLAGNTTTGENWSCQGYATDGVGSGTLMSANVTIINDAPSISSMSLTTPAYKLTTLTCSATISDSRTPSVTGTFKWYDNGALVATNPYTQAANTTFTDTSAPPHTQFHNITCSLNASDGELSVVQNASVNISNNAPVITVSLTPSSPYPTSNMSCVVAASDDDGDTLSGLIMWYINGTSILVNTSWSGVPGSYASYLSGYFNATDNISCSSNASDTFTTVSAFSVNRTVRSGSRPSSNFTVHNYTYSDFTDYIEGHFDDYGAYYLAILVYAFSYLMTQKYPQTLILGGVGLVAVFFMSGNPMFLAGGILSTVLGYMYKQVTG